MRIGLYGMPTSGKTFILERVDFLDVFHGSELLHQYDPDFDKRDEGGKETDRKALAQIMLSKDEFIMDGHYAFGDKIVFTKEDGCLFDSYIYLYVDPAFIRHRMMNSEKNKKYLGFDIEKWQNSEINGLREYCHKNNKDFYVVDNPPANMFYDVSDILDFIRDIKNGYSCVKYAKMCADEILYKCIDNTIILFDGDKTLTIEDSSNKVMGYHTHSYDGNFYSGFQAWKQKKEFCNYICPDITELPVSLNKSVSMNINSSSFILTSGHPKIWKFISEYLKIPYYCGFEMSAETKLFITKFLQNNGRKVIAYGDGMNDYYMLKQADKGFLIKKQDGQVSKSLIGKDLRGINIV